LGWWPVFGQVAGRDPNAVCGRHPAFDDPIALLVMESREAFCLDNTRQAIICNLCSDPCHRNQ
jgi:hypothetical protein